MGIRSPVSSNYAMILGGLKEGVTPLDMAHAYETFARAGARSTTPSSARPTRARPGSQQISCPTCRHKDDHSTSPTYKRVLPPAVAATVQQMLEGVVQSGTAHQRADLRA